ncbi:MAG: hypothetical protein ACRDMZ_04000, partial [Solirubrobacteraceae bacterium]
MVARAPDPLALARPLSASGLPAALAVALFAPVWTLFVFDGSQALYLVALGLVVIAAAALGWARSWLAALLIVMLATLVGSEARSELGHGTPLLPSVRLLDAALLAAVAAVVARQIAERGLQATAGALRLRRLAPSVEGWIVLGATAWAGLLWLAGGAVRGALLNTDVRLVLLAGGSYALGRAVLPGQWERFAQGLLALAPLLFAKAAAIFFTAFFTVGTFDRLQTTFVELPSKRVILVGGDTLLILLPALATTIALRATTPAARRLSIVAGACGMAAVLLSGTRTSLLVAAALVLATICVPVDGRRPRVTGPIAAAAA